MDVAELYENFFDSEIFNDNFVVYAKGKDQINLLNTLNAKLNKINLFGLCLPIYEKENFEYAKKEDVLDFMMFKSVRMKQNQAIAAYTNPYDIYQWNIISKAKLLKTSPKRSCKISNVLSLEGRLYTFEDCNIRKYYNLYGKYLFDCDINKYNEFVAKYETLLENCNVYKFIRDEVRF